MITPWADKEIDWAKRSKKDLEKHREERMTHGFSYVDAWSFDTYIASVISNYAEHARKTNHGYPASLTEEKWDRILEKIQHGYGNYAEGKFDIGPGDEQDKMLKELNKAQKLFKKWFVDFWD